MLLPYGQHKSHEGLGFNVKYFHIHIDLNFGIKWIKYQSAPTIAIFLKFPMFFLSHLSEDPAFSSHDSRGTSPGHHAASTNHWSLLATAAWDKGVHLESPAMGKDKTFSPKKTWEF